MDPSSPGFYSRIFLVPKPDGTFRPIIDLKKSNLFLDIPLFKMETLYSIKAALQPQEWITKIYLKDAYYHIPVHVNICKCFHFVIAGKTYQFRVLPFGLATAPESSPKLKLQWFSCYELRESGSMLIWMIGSSVRIHQHQNRQHTQTTISLLQSLGWTINWKSLC